MSESMTAARNIVNQLGDMWYDAAHSGEDWISFRQRTNDESDEFVEKFIKAAEIRGAVAALNTMADELPENMKGWSVETGPTTEIAVKRIRLRARDYEEGIRTV